MSEPTEKIETQKIVYKELPELSELGKAGRKKAAEYLAELAVVSERLALDKKRVDELKQKLEALQGDLPGLRYNEFCFVSRWMPGRRTLDKMLLVENGVSADIIKASTKTGEPFLERNFKVLGKKGEDAE